MKPFYASRFSVLFCGVIAVLGFCLFCMAADKSDSKTKDASAQSKTASPAPEKSKNTAKSEPKAKTEPSVKEAENIADEEDIRKPVDLGPPLVDRPDDLKRLDPTSPVWLDPKQKQVVFQGQACKATYGLEFLVTFPDRDYEAVISSTVKPSVVHAGLLATGAEPGHPAKFQPQFEPATGAEIEIELRWKDKAGKMQKSPAQQWIRNVKTKQPLDVNWVFAGSGVFVDEETKKSIYEGDSGDFISVLNLPTSTLDLPIRSVSSLESRMFEGNADRVPPKGTPVTVILKPKLEKKDKQ
jgi:hypothetical protein